MADDRAGPRNAIEQLGARQQIREGEEGLVVKTHREGGN
jgi:hypothetical protein